ncbi:MAG TPA: YdcF family protein [Dokdonella sp.]|uniref:YdcF family protein n=1 Tax=Dokdonella sp. TaxID=2291710 RepID=UPI002D7E9A14|nr:YdcF family protein [Dokdonella sp.]HET9032087.1 YdcF family protein [Dokdonella sp.]
MLLSKILTQLIYPLPLCLLLVPMGLLMRGRWPRLGVMLCVFGLGWLLLWSLPVPSSALGRTLEQTFPQQAEADLPEADAIVVLGGGVSRNSWGIDLKPAADRVWFGARLYRAGRAPLVLLSGGCLEELGYDWPEAPAMATFLHDLGVPESAMLLESESRTTRENALYSEKLLRARGINRVLLVTSALHMPRALATFRKLGIDAIPAPTDFEAEAPSGNWLMRWLPDTDSLDFSSRAMKEYLGMWVYRIRGWA